jgi:hypothetical protein
MHDTPTTAGHARIEALEEKVVLRWKFFMVIVTAIGLYILPAAPGTCVSPQHE